MFQRVDNNDVDIRRHQSYFTMYIIIIFVIMIFSSNQSVSTLSLFRGNNELI
jgi:hypothetical protein